MSEIDLVLVNETENCTLYSIQFQTEDQSEFERFYNKFKETVTITERSITIKSEDKPSDTTEA